MLYESVMERICQTPELTLYKVIEMGHYVLRVDMDELYVMRRA